MRQSKNLRLTVDTELMSALTDVSHIDAAGFHGCDDGWTVCEFHKVYGNAFLIKIAFFLCRHHGP